MSDITPLAYEQFTPELQVLLAPRLKRLGYIGAFFQLGAHQPEALGHFIGLTEALKAKLPNALTETIALTIATWAGNGYERVQHERLCLTLGFDKDWIGAVERLEPEALPALEGAAQKLALAAVRSHGRDARAEAEALLGLTDAETLVGALFTIGRYVSHAIFCNALGVAQPFASPLDDQI